MRVDARRRHPSWKVLVAALDLGVAVGAEQGTFLCLEPEPIDPQSQSARAEPEPLRGRIDVMELERRLARVVAAQSTGPARFIDQQSLDATAATRHRLGATPHAALEAIASDDERDLTVDSAGSCRAPVVRRRPSPTAAGRLQAVATKPVPHRPGAPVDPGRDGSHGQPLGHEQRERLP